MQKMDEYNDPTLTLGMPHYISAQPYGVPAGYTLPPPPPGPPPMRWEYQQQEAPSRKQVPSFQQTNTHPSYQIDTPYTPYAWAPQQHHDAVPVDGFTFAPPPTHAMPAQPRRPSALGGLVKDVMSAGRNAIDSVKQDSGAQGWKNAAHAFQGVTINRPPPLPTRPNTLEAGSPVQNFQYNTPVFQEQALVSPVFQEKGPVSPVFPKQVAMSSVEQVAPKPEIKRKPVRPLGDQFKSMGTSAVNFVKSEKGASLLSGAATALNFIASAADPNDPDMAGLTFFNTVVQSQVQKNKTKHETAAAETQAVDPKSSETTHESREGDNAPQNLNPLAGLPPEQLMLIIVMAARLQQQAAVEQARVTDPGDPEVPVLSTLDIEDPPEAAIEDLQTARDAPAPAVAPASAPPAMAPAPAPAPAVEDEAAAAATGPSNLEKAGNVGKAYMNIAIKANSNPLGTSMNMWSEVGRQVNKYRAKQASGTAEPRTVVDMASAFGTALMKSIERVGAPSEGQNNSLTSLVQRYQESEVVAQQRLQEIEATEAAINSIFPSQVSSNAESSNEPASPLTAVAAAPVTTTTGSLERVLAGNYRYLRTGNGWNENNSYALGTNGRFSFSIGSSVIAVSLDQRVSAYAYDVTNPTGTWRAQGDVNNGTLILNHDDGSVEHRSYQRASDGKFYVGGMRWFSV